MEKKKQKDHSGVYRTGIFELRGESIHYLVSLIPRDIPVIFVIDVTQKYKQLLNI